MSTITPTNGTTPIVYNIDDGDVLKLSGTGAVDLTGITAMKLRVAGGSNGGQLEVHADSATGTLLGTYEMLVTEGLNAWERYRDRYLKLTTTLSGSHDIYLVFKTGNGSAQGILNLDWVEFTDTYPYTPATVTTVNATSSTSGSTDLLVNGKRFVIKGISYDPTEPGEYYWRFNYDRLLPVTGLQATNNEQSDTQWVDGMHANVIRTYGAMTGLEQLDELDRKHIKVIMQVWAGGTDNFHKAAVKNFKDHPAILAWQVGNEVNYNMTYPTENFDSDPSNDRVDTKYADMEWVVGRINNVIADIKAIDTNHPVTVSWGNPKHSAGVIQGGGAPSSWSHWTEINKLTSDVMSFQLYEMDTLNSGGTTSSIFDNYRSNASPIRPMWISEYGADSWDATNCPSSPTRDVFGKAITPCTAGENGQNYADPLLTGLIRDESNAAGSGKARVAVGGSLFSLTDGWWKGNQTSLWDQAAISRQDLTGVAPGSGPWPDKTFNEEFWGILRLQPVTDPSTSTSASDIKYYRRTAKTAYSGMASTYGAYANCFNGVQDTASGETGVDCGGAWCSTCGGTGGGGGGSTAVCGNGVIESGEECDDGNSSNTDSCTTACKAAKCGDGYIQGSEQCDNALGDLSTCTADCKLPTCSDATKNGTETGIDCGGSCSACASTCGNSVKEPGEECDNGASNSDTSTTSTCSTKCVAATCSDGVQNEGEAGPDCGGPCTLACQSGHTGTGLILKIEAESGALTGCSSQGDGTASGGSDVIGFETGDTIKFSNVNMSGITALKFQVGIVTAGGNIEIHADSASGPLLGTFNDTAATGGWSTWAKRSVKLNQVADGTHDIYLKGGSPSIGNWIAAIDYLELWDTYGPVDPPDDRDNPGGGGNNSNGTCYNVSNCAFASGTTGWTFSAAGGTGATSSVVSGEYKVSRTSNGAAGDVRLTQSGLSLATNTSYTLSFDARIASGSKSVGYYIYYNGDPAQRSTYCTANLTASTTHFSCPYSTNGSTSWGVGFDLGGGSNIADLYIDQVSIVGPGNAATCTDGIQNQNETGVDCGGVCPACGSGATCTDGVQNQGETGIDCGGPCSACPTGCTGIGNCDFGTGVASPWTLSSGGSSAGVSGTVSGGAYVLSRTANGAGGDIQLKQDSLSLTSGTKTLSFQGKVASGTKSVWFYVYYNGNTGNRSAYCSATLTTTLSTYTCSYTVSSGMSSYGYAFDLGAESNTANITLDNISIN